MGWCRREKERKKEDEGRGRQLEMQSDNLSLYVAQ